MVIDITQFTFNLLEFGIFQNLNLIDSGNWALLVNEVHGVFFKWFGGNKISINTSAKKQECLVMIIVY